MAIIMQLKKNFNFGERKNHKTGSLAIPFDKKLFSLPINALWEHASDKNS